MNLRKFTIRKLLYFSAAIILTSITIFTSIFFVQQNTSRHDKELLQSIERINQYNLKMQLAKDEFLFRDAYNSQLYQTNSSINSRKMDSLTTLTLQELKYLEQNFGNQQIAEIKKQITLYHQNFNSFKNLVITRGFKDYGLEGELRTKIHMVEKTVNLKADYRLMSNMLMLRRHEKDYIIRRDTSYLRKFSDAAKVALQYASNNYGGTKSEISQQLIDYSKLFQEYALIDEKIGRNDNLGALAELNNQSELYTQQLEQITKELATKILKNNFKAHLSMLLLIMAVSILVLLIFAKISRHITKTIKSIQSIIKKLGKGELPKPIAIIGNDEFSNMENSINDLSIALKNTRDFAIEVGNGNFYSEVNVFGNTGELGSRLLEMRKKLMEVAIQQENNIKENQRRSWLNENLAKTADLLRANNSDTTSICFEFIHHIIKATDALQGGVFLLTKSEEDGKEYLDLIASYAYDRRKYINKRFEKYEGIIGACLYEKDLVFITDIPKDYTHLTTGLGIANPSCIVVVPLLTDMDETIGVLEIASHKIIDDIQVEFLKKGCQNLASSLKFFNMISENEKIIAQMKLQTEELMSSEEELRQNMEELKATREDMERREEELLKEIRNLNHKIYSIDVEVDSRLVRN
ncbi:MAG: GAF domain-containing protein [Bacteroidales bacterium]